MVLEEVMGVLCRWENFYAAYKFLVGRRNAERRKEGKYGCYGAEPYNSNYALGGRRPGRKITKAATTGKVKLGEM